MVEDIKINGLDVSFTIVLTTPACPLKDRMRDDCIRAIHQHADARANVTVNFTSRMEVIAPPQLSTVKHVIAVVSGKGGVGKSTVAANLAIALAQSGAKVGILDADIYGPSLPILFGIEAERPFVEQVNGKEMMIPIERFGVKVNSIGFMVAPDQAIIWRGPMASKAMTQLLFDTQWGELDYLIVDMPPGTGDIHMSLVGSLPLSGVVVVTTPQRVATADARKGAEMFQNPQLKAPILGVVENMSWFIPEDMPEKRYAIFGSGGGAQLAEAIHVPLLGQLPLNPNIRESGDQGSPIMVMGDSPVARAFRDVAGEVARRISVLQLTLA